jgi:hypothetical protein
MLIGISIELEDINNRKIKRVSNTLELVSARKVIKDSKDNSLIVKE